VEDLLDFSRLERGEVALRPERLDLAFLLDEVLEDFRHRPGGEHLVGAWPAALWVEADRVRVRQVLGNLLENALRYAPGQPITLRARPVGAENLEGVIRSDGAAARVEVVDQGPGIGPDEQTQVWGRLYRGRGVAELNVARGMGIGLAVVKTLVEAQGGRVGVESTPGLGSCFWFELPAAAPDVPRPTAAGDRAALA
jgi:signal transduction histidine kinase